MESGRIERRRGGTRRSADTWRTLIAEQERSGLGVAAFAAARGVRPATLSWWKSEFRRRDGARRPDATQFVELVAPRPGPMTAGGFEAVLRSGVVLRAAADVDVEAFARCAAALERAC
ncbi:MAG TPA: IS66 family insertion sequence element accessory protein TnpB [Planctomycetota bacterium]|nr:IS66 family insertion sequence element accessory protein TnpB [Planctomycetota bacterium]